MIELNLPPAPLKCVERDGRPQVFDALRRRYVALTPEERVRQTFVAYLIAYKGYPAGLLGNEVSLRVGPVAKRCDTVLYDLRAQPRMIVEYKAPGVAITQKVFDQITRYNMTLHVPYLIVSNGLTHYCLRCDLARLTYTFLHDIPPYSEL